MPEVLPSLALVRKYCGFISFVYIVRSINFPILISICKFEVGSDCILFFSVEVLGI